MRLVELNVLRLPGIPHGFRLEAAPGVNVITGPNGSGKSSLTRAIRSLFWPGIPTGAPFSVEARFQEGAIAWKAAREDGRPVRWWRDGNEHAAPEAPGETLQRCYEMGVLDLVLPPGGEVERELAAAINREISGGVDLVETAESLFPDRKALATRRRKAWQEARRVLNELQAEQRRLAAEEQQLADLRRQSAAGREAAAHLPWWRDFVQHAEAGRHMDTLQARLESFPPEMDRVRAEDAETLARLESDLATNRRARQEAAAQLDNARALVAELNWPAADPEVVARYGEALVELEKQGERTAADRARAAARLEQARRDLASRQDPEIGTPTAEAYDQLARAYARLAEREGRKEGLDSLLQWPEWETDPRAEGAAMRRDHLRALLLLTPPDRNRASWAAWLGTLAALGGGAWMLWQGDRPAGAALTGVGLVALGGWILAIVQKRREQGAHADRRKEILAQLDAAGLSLDTDPSPAEITRLLEEQTNLLSATETRTQWRAFLGSRRQALTEDTHEAAGMLARLRRDHGLELDLEEPDLLNLLQALPRYRSARDEVAALAAEQERQEAERDRLLERLATELAAFGEPTPEDRHEALAALQRVRRRAELFRDRQQTVRELESTLEEKQRDRKRLQEERESLRARLDVPEEMLRQKVDSLVNNLPAWHEARDAVAGQRAVLASLATRLENPPAGLDPEAAHRMTDADIGALMDGLQTRAEEAETLISRIAQVEQRIRAARQDHKVAEAAAAETAAREALAELRRELQDAALGRLLLEDVESSHQRATRPRVLEQAALLFREFTRDLYELRVVPGPGRQGLFVAHDLQAGVNLGLAEISDGTRAQLLLAVRLAFITENEEGSRPPLFLDESLTSSDPDRFAAIARNLTRWAQAQDRQVFYLTSQPMDAAAWQQAMQEEALPAACVIDLAVQRGLAAAAELPAPVVVQSAIPAPGEMDATAYARALKVPVLDPWRGAGEAHLWYLLFDEPDRLHRLLLAAASTLGLYRARRDQLPVLAEMEPAQLRRIDARGAALEAFLPLWRIGRGRPLLGHDLIRSELITENFLPRCLEVLDHRQGDASLFLQDLRQGKVPRFRKAGIQALEDYLEREGFLDRREPLEAEALLGRVQSQLLGEIRRGTLQTEETRHLVETWRRVLQSVGRAGEATDRSS